MKKSEPKKNDELATIGMTPAEFGTALIDEAQARKQKEKLEKSINQAKGILSSLEECNSKIEWFQGWKKTHEGQLAALKAGKFTFDTFGAIVYNDPDLNRK